MQGLRLSTSQNTTSRMPLQQGKPRAAGGDSRLPDISAPFHAYISGLSPSVCEVCVHVHVVA